MGVYFFQCVSHKSLSHYPQNPLSLTAINWADQLNVAQSFSDDKPFSTPKNTQITTLFCGKFDCLQMPLSDCRSEIWLLLLCAVITKPVNLSLSGRGEEGGENWFSCCTSSLASLGMEPKALEAFFIMSPSIGGDDVSGPSIWCNFNYSARIPTVACHSSSFFFPRFLSPPSVFMFLTFTDSIFPPSLPVRLLPSSRSADLHR